MQTKNDVISIQRAWYANHETQDFLCPTEDSANGHEFATWIWRNAGGIYSLESLDLAYAALKHKLRKKYQPKTPQQLEAERVQAKDAANYETAKTWIRDFCPSGLVVNGDLYPGDQDRIVAFVTRNYDLKKLPLTYDMLNEGVHTLANVLTWFDKSPEATKFRGVYAPQPPKPKQLSEKQQLEAGLKPARLKSHSEDKHVSLQEQLRETAKKAKAVFDKTHGIQSREEMYKGKLERISVTNRLGKRDYPESTRIQAIRVHNADGTVNYEASYAEAYKQADTYEKNRNK
jgi:hypothetical protein